MTFVSCPLGCVAQASYWGRGTEEGDGLFQVRPFRRCPGQGGRDKAPLSPCDALGLCVQVRFDHRGPGHGRHEQEGAAGDPEEVGMGCSISKKKQ